MRLGDFIKLLEQAQAAYGPDLEVYSEAEYDIVNYVSVGMINQWSEDQEPRRAVILQWAMEPDLRLGVEPEPEAAQISGLDVELSDGPAS